MIRSSLDMFLKQTTKFWNKYSLKTTQKKYADIDESARVQEAELRTSSASKNIRRIWGMCRREGKAGERGSHNEADFSIPAHACINNP